MSQPRKGTATLFRADRRWYSSLPRLTIEVFLHLKPSMKVPSRLLLATAALNILSEAKEEAAFAIIKNFLMNAGAFSTSAICCNSFLSTQLYSQMFSSGIGHVFLAEKAIVSSSQLSEYELEITLNPKYQEVFSLLLEAACALQPSAWLLLEQQPAEFINFSFGSRMTAKQIILSKILFRTKLAAEMRESQQFILSLLPKAVLPIMPGVAVFSLPLYCQISAESKINMIESLWLSLLSFGFYSLPLLASKNLQFFSEGELATELRVIAPLKNKIAFCHELSSGASAFLTLQPIYFVPSVSSLIAEASFLLHSAYSLSQHHSLVSKLLINHLIKMSVLAPNNFNTLLKLSPSITSQQQILF